MIWAAVALTKNSFSSLTLGPPDFSCNFQMSGGPALGRMVLRAFSFSLLLALVGCFSGVDPNVASAGLSPASLPSPSLRKTNIPAGPGPEREPSEDAEASSESLSGRVVEPRTVNERVRSTYPGSIKADARKSSLFRLEWESKVSNPLSFVLRLGPRPKELKEEIQIPLSDVQTVDHPLYGQLYRYYLDKAPYCPVFYVSITVIASEGTQSVSEPFAVKAPCVKSEP